MRVFHSLFFVGKTCSFAFHDRGFSKNCISIDVILHNFQKYSFKSKFGLRLQNVFNVLTFSIKLSRLFTQYLIKLSILKIRNVQESSLFGIHKSEGEKKIFQKSCHVNLHPIQKIPWVIQFKNLKNVIIYNGSVDDER